MLTKRAADIAPSFALTKRAADIAPSFTKRAADIAPPFARTFAGACRSTEGVLQAGTGPYDLTKSFR